MIIRKYGITLVRLKEKHIELVRQKRNLSYIQEAMVYKKEITPEMQKKWFDSINNVYNLYFLIEYENDFIGLINGKNIDFEKRSSEGGIFLWEKKYWDTQVPVIASLILNDYNFQIANFRVNYAKIMQHNTKAIEYNKSMGYKIIEKRDDGTIWMGLSKKDYLSKIEKVRKGISIVTGDHTPLSPKDFFKADDSLEDVKQLYTDLPEHILQFLTSIN